MRGSIPKSPEMRQRRNRTSTAATLSDDGGNHRHYWRKDGSCRCGAGALPERGDGQPWHPMTLAWWDDIWRSPMASEYLDSDRHGLFLLADLIDRYWHNPSTKLAGEIRQQRQCFGLTPIDRRRLQWEVERAAQASRKGMGQQVNRNKDTGDPRDALESA